MPVLRRPFQNNMFGFSNPDPSYGFRGTAFRSYNPRRPQVPPSYDDSPQDAPDLILPSPTPPPAVPSPQGIGGSMPTFRAPNVAFDRANDANADATYLKALPSSSDPIVNAMRARSIAAKSGIANGFTGNQYLGRELATDANSRANSMNTAQVGGINAYSNTMIPALAGQATSAANLNNANAADVTGMLPYNQKASAASTEGKTIQNRGEASILPYLPKQAEQGVRTAQLRNERDSAMLPADVANAGLMGKNMAAINAEREKLLEDQRRFVSMKTPVGPDGQPIGAQPNKWDAMNEEYDLRAKADPEGAKAWLKLALPSTPGQPAESPQSTPPNLRSSIPSLLSGNPGPALLSAMSPSAPPSAPQPAQQTQPIKLRDGRTVTKLADGTFVDAQGNRFNAQGKFIGK